MKIKEIDRSDLFCIIVVDFSELLIVFDVSFDLRFKENKLVKNDFYIWFYVGYFVRLLDGEIVGIICIIDIELRVLIRDDFLLFKDLVEIVEDEFRIINEVIIDFLIGICNWCFFVLMMDELLRKVKKKKKIFCVLIIDFDNFKLINDNFGYLEGNEVFCNFVDMLEDFSSLKSVVVRLGGDEFGVLLFELIYKEVEEFFYKLRVGIISYNFNF